VVGATLRGVTLLPKARKRGRDIFDVVLTSAGIEIWRPGAPARHMPWEQISQWEIAQRSGGVQLVLRGGGTVTALIVPDWSVDRLDAVLRAVTTPMVAFAPSGDPAS
jgi:hypothetical protein